MSTDNHLPEENKVQAEQNVITSVEANSAPVPSANEPQKKPATMRDRVLTIVGIVLCVILVPLLIANVTMIIQSYVNEDEVPSVFGITPFIVLTESMEPTINAGDLIITVAIDPVEVEVGDVISFFDPSSSSQAVVTHRVYEIVYNDDGSVKAFKTYGDNNKDANGEISYDTVPVPASNLIGEYAFSIPLAGHVAMFMQTTAGLIVCVVVPLVALVAYDILRRRLYEKKKSDNMDTLLQELEALRKEKEEKSQQSQNEEKGE